MGRSRLVLICTVLLLAACGRASLTDEYPLLAKRILAPDVNDALINFNDLRIRMREYMQDITDPIGVYFEYLPSGVSIGINEEERFIAASLLKVPIVMEAYVLRNAGKLDFATRVRLVEQDLDNGFGSLWKRGAGAELTVAELNRLILTESDNTARAALVRTLQEVHPAFLDDAFDNLDLPKELAGNDPVVSAENYSSVLRSLYLASSLPKEDAQDILQFMAQSVYRDKLPADLPSDVPVAHKIGVYDVRPELLTYSDCGIVYVPRRPFLLCVIAQTDEKNATAAMRDLARMAYDFVSATPAGAE